MTWPTIISIWLLSFGMVVGAWHRWQQDKRILKLDRKVWELEMERDFPGWRQR